MWESISFDQARGFSREALLWYACLTTGETLWEQPGLSSDALPPEQVKQIGYRATTPGCPSIRCDINLDLGERFVRYWSSMWTPRHGYSRVYCVGVRHEDRYGLMGFYPGYRAFVLGATRPFGLPREPDWRKSLPSDAIMVGGPRERHLGFLHRGFGCTVTAESKDLLGVRGYRGH